MKGKLDKATVNIVGKGEIVVKKGEKLKDIAKIVSHDKHKNILGARINNEIKHLNYIIDKDCTVEFFDITNIDGLRIYMRTLTFIYIKACKDIFEDCEITIEHSLSKGIYSEIHKKRKLSLKDIEDIKNRMKEIIDSDIEIKRERITIKEAEKIFTRQGMDDKLKLLKYREKEYIHVYNLDGYYDTFYGYLTPSTGYINKFDLRYYHPGVIIQFPRKESNFNIPKFEEQNKLAKIFKESEEWGDILEVGYVGALNEKIEDGSFEEIIRISEALHEKKIAYIADRITKDDDIRVVLIAGPSSSGKTTFTERLAIQLKVNGKKPISISIDDYFVNREDTPRKENGEYDFESIEAIDVKKFNEDLIKLMDGEIVELPTYNFITGRREYRGRRVQIDKDQPILIEGIHGLNEKLTSLIPHKNKFKIYVSALTQLNIDRHNRIPTTDTRLIRRIVRDSKYRGNTALMTLKLWNSVRDGEEKNIFPYQEEADVMFNSALAYELAVLKKYAVPLLKEIDSASEYYSESKRLLKFLNYFKSAEYEFAIPNTSIIREFIGGSCFRKE
jgi:uridine kinase